MRNKIIFIVICIFCLVQWKGYAQEKDFKEKQRKQEKVIEQAYKKKKITELEYNKLMREQELIKETMEKFEADDVWTSKEKNAMHSKLERAEKRMSKYKTNNEIY